MSILSSPESGPGRAVRPDPSRPWLVGSAKLAMGTNGAPKVRRDSSSCPTCPVAILA